MNIAKLNVAANDNLIVKQKGGGGGVTINNQEKSLEITENGTTEVTADSGFTGLSKVVVNTNVQSGGAPVSKPVNDVNYYDYDGTVLYSYTKDEFLALSDVPPFPEREGLMCQGWNWFFTEAKEYVAEYGLCDIGATYVTKDGNTRLYISLAEDITPPITLRFAGSSYTASVDWGDGSPIESLSASMSHSYQKKGDYCISIDVTKGTVTLSTNASSVGTTVLGGSSYFPTKVLRKAEIGAAVYLGTSCFYMTSLQSITLPRDGALNSTRFSKVPFGRTQLKHITIPQEMRELPSEFIADYSYSSISLHPNTSLSKGCFKSCYNLQRVVLPPTLTSIPESLFENNQGLVKVVIPKNVTAIGASAFYGAKSLKIVDCSKCMQCPTLGSSAFSYASTDYKIIVPDALYDTWIAATNWSSLASYIIKKSDWDASQS